jgi:hypothetical protein
MSVDQVIRDWDLRLESVDLPKRTMDALVLDWLVNQGHCEAAQAFARECGTPADGVDAIGIIERVAIRQAVESGNIQAAIDAAQKLDSRVRLRMTIFFGVVPSPAARSPTSRQVPSFAYFPLACRFFPPTHACSFGFIASS